MPREIGRVSLDQATDIEALTVMDCLPLWRGRFGIYTWRDDSKTYRDYAPLDKGCYALVPSIHVVYVQQCW